MLPIGLQVYSVRDTLSKDFNGTLEHLAKFGYEGVELFGDLPANTAKFLGELGLRVPGKHGLYDDFAKDLQPHIDQTLELNAPVLVCAWSMPNDNYSWEKITENLEIFAQAVKKQGLTFAYHNHGHELLQKVGNQTVLDYMAENAPSLHFELDIAWLHSGGVNPSDYLEKYASRTALVHVKDVKKNSSDWDTVELGQGEVGLAKALTSAHKTATQWLLIEQDHSDDPMRSAKNNLEWLKANS
jgi:sugar phosphate isomerase/epimerase